MTCTSPEIADVSDYEMIEATRAALGLLSGRWSVDVLYLLASGTRRDVKVMTFGARVVGSDRRRRVRRRPLTTAIPWPGRQPAKA